MTAHAATGANQSAFPGVSLPAMGRTASGRPWRLRPYDGRTALAIEQRAGVDPLIARILASRGVAADEAEAYLNPSLRNAMPDPFILRDMERAAARLATAVMSGEKVGVFGDYDVDGTTAAAIFQLYFKALGAAIEVYLPDRLIEGYGPSIEAFRELKKGGASLIVTVDCGAAAHGVIEQAAGEGLDIVVIDHHLMDGPPPAGAVATVNPNRPDDVSGLGNLSAAGVAFLAVVALNRALREQGFFVDRAEPRVLELLDLAALGLVCDVMPITGLTRVMVAQGLKLLSAGGNPGLAALARISGAKGAFTAYHLGFLLGPRINAAGRIGHARLALELLCSEDATRREALAQQLHRLNAERQAVETAVLAEATARIERDRLFDRPLIVAAGEGWHPGVIGIVAGRLKESYDAPAIIIGLDGDIGKGSGRSIAGVDLGAAIARARREGLLISGGGHAMAAGLALSREAIGPFTEFMETELGAAVASARLGRVLDIDGVVALSAVTAAFAETIARAGPFGPGNPEPTFAIADARVEALREVGTGHLSCALVSATGERVRAIAFRAGESALGGMLAAGRRLHVAGRIKADEWRGRDAGQLHIQDAALAD